MRQIRPFAHRENPLPAKTDSLRKNVVEELKNRDFWKLIRRNPRANP
jgi:hypothetical protein